MPTKLANGLESIHPRFILIAIAIILMALWLIPWTAPILDQLDEYVFYALNGSLTWGYYWQMYWAFANHRAFDLVMAIVYCTAFTAYCFHQTDRETAGRRFAELFTLMLTLLLVIWVVHFFFGMLNYRRQSPTRVLEAPVMLSEVFEGWKVKDRSNNSYPGDHALVSLYLCLYFITRSTRTYALIFVGIAIIAILPRLVGGAHWITDIIAGSFFFAVIAWFIVEGSGLFEWTVKKFQCVTNRVIHPIHGWIQRWTPGSARLLPGKPGQER